jgi:Tol biopolymer transport system component
MTLEPGQMLAHYRLERKIGEGGMGVVYVAEDTRLGRRVALKVLPAEMAGDTARKARFEREARAIAALNHPNIVTLHSIEEAGEISFLTMELVDGRRLTELLPKDGLDLRRILEFSLAIADALVAAHQQGVVHRDLKPDNIMITLDGRLKVLDFGLAKLGEPVQETSNTALPTASLTEEGKIVGTVAYMSPEQAEGKSLDHRSDMFSFGVVLYEMATGRRPFQGDTAISTLSSILRDTPTPPQQINTSLPAHLGRIVRRCLAKEPERRYHSTEDLRNDLRELKEDSESGELTAEGVAAEVASRPARAARGPLLVGVGIAVVALAALGGWLWTRWEAGPATAGAAQAPIQMSRVTTDGKVAEVAISPDGRYVAYVRREGPIQSLRLRLIATGDEVQVVAPGEVSLQSPSFSADGDFLYYTQNEPGQGSGSAYQVSVLGGTPRRILDGVDSISASPDGRSLAMTGGPLGEVFLRVSGASGESPRDLAFRKGSDHFDSQPAWAPDGSSIAIVSHRFGQPQQVVLVDVGTGEERPFLLPALKTFSELHWMPGGDSLIVTGSERPANQGATPQIWQVSMTGDLQPLTRDLNSYFDVAVTADGSTVATVQVETRSGIDVAPVNDGMPGAFTELFPVSAARAGAGSIAWLTPAQLLHDMQQADLQQIFVTDVGTKASRALTSGASHHFPAVSRDGRTLVVMRDEGTQSNLWRLDPDSGREEQITEGAFDGLPSVSSDGAWLLHISAGESLTLWKRSMTEEDAVALLKQPAFCPDISPDDREALCWVMEPSRDWASSIVPIEGGDPRPIPGLPQQPGPLRYGPDGRSITYITSREGATELWSFPREGGEARRLVRFDGKEIANFAWSPDGRRLAVVEEVRSGDVILLRR